MASSGQACIEAKFVTKSYGKPVALDDVSFSIPCGERYALLGPNGAGKSTTLKLLVGLLKPDTGTIRISGYEPFSSDAKSILGYLPEDATPYRTLSVRENLEYIAALRGVRDVREATDRFLDELSLREYERAKVGKLSRGNMQKLAIALDRKSTRLNSSHSQISYAVFCLKKKKNTIRTVLLSTRLIRYAQRMLA